MSKYTQNVLPTVPAIGTQFDRMLPLDTLKTRYRLTMLGNVCVPQQASAAFHALQKLRLVTPLKTYAELPQKMPVCGTMRAGTVSACAKLKMPEHKDANIVLVPRDTGPTNQRLAKKIETPLRLKRWATPRACMGLAPSGHRTGIAKNLTVRSKNDIQTQIRFEKSTKEGFTRRIVNPNWLEQLMGLPVGFTDF